MVCNEMSWETGVYGWRWQLQGRCYSCELIGINTKEKQKDADSSRGVKEGRKCVGLIHYCY